jgi:hypothetical protein
VFDFNPARGQILRRGGAGHHGQRAAGQSVLREAAAIGMRAGKSEKQIAGIHAPRIVLDSGNFQCGKLRRQRLFEPFAREYLA